MTTDAHGNKHDAKGLFTEKGHDIPTSDEIKGFHTDRVVPETPDGRVDAKAAIALGFVSDEFSTTPFPDGPKTMTFVGHWDNSEIVVEYVYDGERQDDRDNTKYWDEGLWCDWATGASEAEIAAQMYGEFEDCQHIRFADDDEFTPDGDEDEDRTCNGCGDEALYLSTAGYCDGCVEDGTDTRTTPEDTPND